MSKYQDFSKEELLKKLTEFEKELKNKKYGLVWENEKFPEQVVLECENNLPVLEEVKEKEITTVETKNFLSLQNSNTDYNILIEGDNYHALTVLNYTHENKIDVIYIDPPYNTLSEGFTYNDKRVDSNDSFRHSKWLNFMEKRLKLAKNLLKEDGVIFISIDDNEFAQLKLLCDKVFGQDNFISCLPRITKTTGFKGNFFTPSKDYVLCYGKDINKISNFKEDVIDSQFKKEDSKGKYRDDVAFYLSTLDTRPNQRYYIEAPDGSFLITPGNVFPKEVYDASYVLPESNNDKVWRWSFETYLKRKDELVFKETKRSPLLDQNGNRAKYNIYTKTYLHEREEVGNVPRDFLLGFLNRNGSEALKKLGIDFSYPKPVELIKHLIKITNKDKNITILDFFAGSGTTGQAVMELNNDGGIRKYILCTNNENHICEEITYPRIYNATKTFGFKNNLKYFKTSLVKKSKSRSQLKIDITQKCTEMLCLKESVFDEIIKSENYKIFSNIKKDKHLAIYYNFLGDDFSEFIEELKKLNTEIIVYIFSVDNSIDKSLFKGLDVKLEAIPQKILEVYKALAKMNISANSETIFTDFEKAYKRVFEEKDKDDGAVKLRIVLEKILQKLCQLNGIDVINTKGKDEKANLLNNELGAKKVIDQVLWKQNEFYLTIGNESAHGKYDDYTLEQIQDFYKHVQNLIDKFNI